MERVHTEDRCEDREAGLEADGRRGASGAFSSRGTKSLGFGGSLLICRPTMTERGLWSRMFQQWRELPVPLEWERNVFQPFSQQGGSHQCAFELGV